MRTDVGSTAAAMAAEMGRAVEGKPEVIRTTLTVLLAGGHLLLEDVPGVGKTTLARALARTVDASMSRIQFTPDLLPSDITGVSIWRPQTQDFEFHEGPVFANVVVADEINRASPKAQSALLEAMEEQQVTVDGTSHPLPRPFMVMATQNPVDMEGTYPLPEAQRDRFMARVSVGYPSAEAEVRMLETHGAADPVDDIRPVVDLPTLQALVAAVDATHVSDALRRYVVDLVGATRRHADTRLGASPRSGLQLLRAARAHAALEGRDHTLPDDVQAVAPAVLPHRLLLSPTARAGGRTPESLCDELLASVPVPGGRR